MIEGIYDNRQAPENMKTSDLLQAWLANAQLGWLQHGQYSDSDSFQKRQNALLAEIDRRVPWRRKD